MALIYSHCNRQKFLIILRQLHSTPLLTTTKIATIRGYANRDFSRRITKLNSHAFSGRILTCRRWTALSLNLKLSYSLRLKVKR